MAKPLAKLVDLLTPKRTWFQFRLRTLFALVAMLCIPLAWLALRLPEKRRERAAVAMVNEFGGTVNYDWEGKTAEPPGSKWLRVLLAGRRVKLTDMGRPAPDTDVKNESSHLC